MREKLIELLDDIQRCGEDFDDYEIYGMRLPNSVSNDDVADHLIANGVTIQKWIPVTERLPEIPDGWAENPEPVLYMMKITKTIYAGYYGEGGVWRDKYFRQYHESREGVDADDVLCWMWQHDLPEPPKGD